MALALYRKYRPRTFAEIIGQDHVTEPLSQALRSGRLNHAYLFSGPRGCGKTSSARILARSLNCEQGPTPEPCGTCDSCRALVTDGGSIDVMEIDAASHGGVDDARELREKAVFAPVQSRFKIYVIDEAHMVSSAGFNALLKLVEEPPEYVKFIFATTEPEKVLGTIKSRTHHYPFRLIPPSVLRPYLEQLCEAEGVKVEPAVFPLVVRAGGGSARDSLSVLDQLMAGAGPEGVTYARAAALLGVTDAALIDEMCDALAAGDGAAAYSTVNRVAEAGHDARRFASDLLERLRDLIVLQQVPDAAAKGLIDGPADQIERMAAQAQRLGPATLSRCADIVHEGLVEMRGTTAPRLLLELITARMLLPGASEAGLLQRLERMERRLTVGGVELSVPASATAAPEVRPVSPPVPANPQPSVSPTPAAPTGPTASAGPSAPTAPAETNGSAAPVASSAQPIRPAVPPEAVMPDPATPPPPRPGAAATGRLDAAAVRRVWPDVIAMVNRTNKRAAALMRDAVVRDLDGNTLVVTVKSPALVRMMATHAEVMTAALYEEFGGRWEIRCEVAGERGGVARSGPPQPPRTDPQPGSTPQPAASSPAPPPLAAPQPAQVPTAPSASPAHSGGVARPVAPPPADDDWPEAARPGGAANASATATPDGGEDWPETAQLGGAPATTATAPRPATPAAAPARNATESAARPAVPAQPGTATAPAATRAVGGGLAAARAAAAGRGTRTAVKTADADWAGEPPYDPEYDGPSKAPVAAYEGFDPGDEPLDMAVDEGTARQSSEEQALRLLSAGLGAEKIDEIDVR
ncbi:DNA polymerase III subunit gamma and tau [Melissospora conviva]|uniref:DNA polymerase III subunit gamma and tau n=1 Tax=Melissospora conviva TaxID=3388432 RepID=UPI003B77957A